MSNLTKQDWKEFETLFPQAMAFLIRKQNERELEILRQRGEHLTDWGKKRLAELEELERTIAKIKQGG